jgi:hypothetical protein
VIESQLLLAFKWRGRLPQRCDYLNQQGGGLPMGVQPGDVAETTFCAGTAFPQNTLKSINRESWSKYDTMIVGEAIGCKVGDAASIIAERRTIWTAHYL